MTINLLQTILDSFKTIDSKKLFTDMKQFSEGDQLRIITVCVALCIQRPDLSIRVHDMFKEEMNMFKEEINKFAVNTLDC